VSCRYWIIRKNCVKECWKLKNWAKWIQPEPNDKKKKKKERNKKIKKPSRSRDQPHIPPPPILSFSFSILAEARAPHFFIVQNLFLTLCLFIFLNHSISLSSYNLVNNYNRYPSPFLFHHRWPSSALRYQWRNMDRGRVQKGGCGAVKSRVFLKEFYFLLFQFLVSDLASGFTSLIIVNLVVGTCYLSVLLSYFLSRV